MGRVVRHLAVLLLSIFTPSVALWCVIWLSLRRLGAEEEAWERWQAEASMPSLDRIGVPAVAQDGGARHAGRQRRARLQQSADGSCRRTCRSRGGAAQADSTANCRQWSAR
ncbi:MAG: Sensor protein [uncultured Paraburkholderia sp.]|nr:MAG: Sensor protein [uncultured Paraburkholderia sp.]